MDSNRNRGKNDRYKEALLQEMEREPDTVRSEDDKKQDEKAGYYDLPSPEVGSDPTVCLFEGIIRIRESLFS